MSTHVRGARSLFPATGKAAYFNTAAVGLASRTLAASYHRFVDDWAHDGLDYVRGEAAGERARTSVADLIGADRSDVALIACVSAAAGLVAAQFGPAGPGHNLVIGEREYSSNHYPWRMLAKNGYEIRQVPFRNGGLEPGDIAQAVDKGTVLVAFSGVLSCGCPARLCAEDSLLPHVQRATVSSGASCSSFGRCPADLT